MKLLLRRQLSVLYLYLEDVTAGSTHVTVISFTSSCASSLLSCTNFRNSAIVGLKSLAWILSSTDLMALSRVFDTRARSLSLIPISAPQIKNGSAILREAVQSKPDS